MLSWVKKFNPYDGYSKTPERPDVDKVRPYYQELINEYLPKNYNGSNQICEFVSTSDNKIISTAPGRAGIIGNPTDMYGGAVISCSIGPR